MAAIGERIVSQIERDLDIRPELIYKWQQRYRVVEEKLQPSAEQAEIRLLKRELEITRQVRDILKKPFEYSRGGNRESLPVHCSPSPRRTQYSSHPLYWVWSRVAFTTGCGAM